MSRATGNVSEVEVQCPKCGYKKALAVDATFYVTFSEEEEGEPDKLRARVYKCVRCGYVWAEFMN